MLIGAHFAGMAIEQSMLGAAHACANPLTARYNIAHGLALAILLPHVVRWNAPSVRDRYAVLLGAPRRRVRDENAAETLARRLEDFAVAGHLSTPLSDAGVTADAIPELAELAAQQWTGTFNPRPFDAKGAAEIYRAAL
jgi:alcohol dehydrogenase